MKQRLSWGGWLLALLVLLDLVYSFWQYYQLPLDGDIASIILPSPSCAEVLADPLGLKALLEGKFYIGPNRFFAHGGMLVYFSYVPGWLQAFLSPVDSVYAASALLKVLTHAALLYLLGIYVTGTYRLRNYRLWLAMALLTPLFQAKGYQEEMAIIDRSITYTAFYATPLVGLLVYLLPFHLAAWFGRPLVMPAWQVALWLVLALVLALSGPLVGPVVLLVVPVLVLRQLWHYWPEVAAGPWQLRLTGALKRIPRLMWLLLGTLVVLCLYSMYIGQFNIEAQAAEVPIKDRYEKMWMGLYYILAGGLGVPVLFLMAVLNHYILRALPLTLERRRLLTLGNWVFVLVLLYLVLLPLGGYRTYRPSIIRRDTLIPITLGLAFFFTISALYLLRELPARFRTAYGALLALFVFIYTNSDRPIKDDNTCERAALRLLQETSTDLVKLPRECSLLTWYPIPDPNSSGTQVEVLARWHVVPATKRYYQDAQ